MGKAQQLSQQKATAPILFNIWGTGHPGHAGGNSSLALVQEKTKLSQVENQSRKAC